MEMNDFLNEFLRKDRWHRDKTPEVADLQSALEQGIEDCFKGRTDFCSFCKKEDIQLTESATITSIKSVFNPCQYLESKRFKMVKTEEKSTYDNDIGDIEITEMGYTPKEEKSSMLRQYSLDLEDGRFILVTFDRRDQGVEYFQIELKGGYFNLAQAIGDVENHAVPMEAQKHQEPLADNLTVIEPSAKILLDEEITQTRCQEQPEVIAQVVEIPSFTDEEEAPEILSNAIKKCQEPGCYKFSTYFKKGMKEFHPKQYLGSNDFTFCGDDKKISFRSTDGIKVSYNASLHLDPSKLGGLSELVEPMDINNPTWIRVLDYVVEKDYYINGSSKLWY